VGAAEEVLIKSDGVARELAKPRRRRWYRIVLVVVVVVEQIYRMAGLLHVRATTTTVYGKAEKRKRGDGGLRPSESERWTWRRYLRHLTRVRAPAEQVPPTSYKRERGRRWWLYYIHYKVPVRSAVVVVVLGCALHGSAVSSTTPPRHHTSPL
jgi:hypothetical protein